MPRRPRCTVVLVRSSRRESAPDRFFALVGTDRAVVQRSQVVMIPVVAGIVRRLATVVVRLSQSGTELSPAAASTWSNHDFEGRNSIKLSSARFRFSSVPGRKLP